MRISLICSRVEHSSHHSGSASAPMPTSVCSKITPTSPKPVACAKLAPGWISPIMPLTSSVSTLLANRYNIAANAQTPAAPRTPRTLAIAFHP